MKPATLADCALRESFRKRHPFPGVSPALRSLLASSRRFSLDEEASCFLAHLSWANVNVGMSVGRFTRNFEATRVLARLPHAVTWVEYDDTIVSAVAVEHPREHQQESAP
jgi:hypothetical protein